LSLESLRIVRAGPTKVYAKEHVMAKKAKKAKKAAPKKAKRK
jgi:hypothetical protein